MRSNCLIWAVWEYARQLRAWVRAGMPKGREPYLLARPSRYRPRWVPHFLVGQRDQAGGMALRSYKPISGKDAPWWAVLTRLLFSGHEQAGDDFADTVAER